MILGRCSHPIRVERAGARSESKGSKVTVENGVVAPEGRSRPWNSPLGGYSQHKETANTSHPIFWSIQVFASMAHVQMHHDPDFGQGKVMVSQDQNVLPDCSRAILDLPPQGFCEPISRILWTFLKDSSKKSPEMPHACFTCCLLSHLSFSETPWKFIPAKLPWRTSG